MTAHNPRRQNGHRRTRLRQRVLAAYTHCALCGRTVDKTLPAGDPGAPEVDEIIPVSHGGDPLAWANVQLAHRICNQRKGNRVGWTADTPSSSPTPPQTSRQW